MINEGLQKDNQATKAFVFVDSSARKALNQIGLGIVICEKITADLMPDQDSIIEKISEIHAGDRSSMGERLAISRGLYHALERGYQDIVIYNDHEAVIKKLKERMSGLDQRISPEEREIIELSGQAKSLVIERVVKRGNTMAHKLSRQGFKGQ